ncbi:MAG: type II toxin-antitoxin system VapC family toxin [Acidobacteriota bacterium]
MSVVVDASVVVHWLIPGTFTHSATRLLHGEERLLAPDLLVAEVGNAVWKYHRQRLVSREEADTAIGMLDVAPIALQASTQLITDAFQIAADLDRSVYDSLYLALAFVANAPFVTADRKLRNAVAGTPIGEHVVWIEDWPEPLEKG